MIIQEYLNPNSLLLIAIPVPSILLLASVPHGTVPQTPVSDHVLTNVTPPDSVLAQRENFSLISSHVLRSPHFKKLNVLIPIWSLGSQLGWLKQFCTSFSKIDWLSEEFSQIQPIKTAEIKCNQFGKKKGKALHPVYMSQIKCPGKKSLFDSQSYSSLVSYFEYHFIFLKALEFN